MISAFLASIVEAWQELRVHKVRVLMSLIGVGVAVCGLTLVVGFGNMMQKGLVDDFERSGGRDATYMFSVISPSGETSAADAERISDAIEKTQSRFDIDYVSATGQSDLRLQSPTGSIDATLTIVDADYEVMHRVRVEHGRWFTAADAENMAPAIVADQVFLDQYGLDAGALPATVDLPGHQAGVATVIGSVASPSYAEMGTFYALSAQAEKFGPTVSRPTEFEMWLPPDVAQQLSKQVTSDLKRQLPGYTIDSYRSDFAEDAAGALGPVQNVLLAISILILFMGMLGLINISMVTIQQRIREIGIRRSFGATSRRIFFSVMMESVVATTVAGAIGVLIAVLVLKAPIVGQVLFDGMVTPQVPFSAVIVGMLVSIGIGALAGLVPALVAMRVRIIDAIRA